MIAIAALTIAVVSAAYNYFLDGNSWLGWRGGVSALYGRIFVVANYYIMCLVVAKCALTVWAIRRVLHEFTITVRPLHPDGCGGLGPIGDLTLAMSYFVALIMAFCAVMVVLNGAVWDHPWYLVVYVAFYVTAPVMIFISVAPASKKMREEKDRLLKQLGNTLDSQYVKLEASLENKSLRAELARDMSDPHGLYKIASRMSIWPFDAQNIRRFASTYVLPIFIFLIDLATNPDSAVKAFATAIQQMLGS